jgi:hypothetical protein
MKFLVCVAICFFSTQLFAEAGRAIFVSGIVHATAEDGSRRFLRKNGVINPGDLIETGVNGLVQIRMIDKGFISIRRNSQFKIEAFELGATKEEDSGLFSLLKGGFRAITGVIGKRLRSVYQVKTVVATIGIRGTDYTARLCNKDCSNNFGIASSRTESVIDGLYIGVIDGGVLLKNNLGTLNLDELQYGYVKDAGSAPIALLNAPEFLFFKSRQPNTEDEDSAENDSNVRSETITGRQKVRPQPDDVNNNPGIKQDANIIDTGLSQNDIDNAASFNQSVITDSGTVISLNDTTLGSSRAVAMAIGASDSTSALSAVSNNPSGTVSAANQGLTGFGNQFLNGVTGQYGIGNASNIDVGFDPVSGISWGRWTNGNAGFSSSGSNVAIPVDLTNSSLHWVAGPDGGNISLPSSGVANYQLIGNTSPTDNLGNTGVLGAASLTANFSNMSTATSINIGINNQVWNTNGVGAIQPNGNFANNLSVTGTDATQGSFTGQGSSNGFFTNNAAGAGMGYALEANVNSTPTNVTGTAVFQQQ